MNKAKLNVNSVSKSFAKTKALDNVSFTLNSGDICGVIGRNGAGKSTLFKIICGLLEQSEGTVSIDNPHKRYDFASYLPEERGLLQKQNVLPHLTDMQCFKGVKRTAAEKMVLAYLKRFGLEKYKDVRIETLSKGNQQLLQFIGTVANRPELIILDEPFTGLDLLVTDRLWELMDDLSELGTTILFSTHSFHPTLNRCDKYLFIKNGKIVEFGSLNEIRSHHSMVLEIDRDSIDEKELRMALSQDLTYRCKNSFYQIDIEKEAEARQLFKRLGSPFTHCFRLRQPSLEELFRFHHREE